MTRRNLRLITFMVVIIIIIIIINYHYHYHHHHYHHHHHHHKHHYCYKVQKPLLSICLSSELSLSILFSSNFICNHFVTILLSFVVVLCGTCFILLLLFWGGREWWGWLTSLGYLSRLCSGPWHLSRVTRKS